jgi:hypothetical protein
MMSAGPQRADCHSHPEASTSNGMTNSPCLWTSPGSVDTVSLGGNSQANIKAPAREKRASVSRPCSMSFPRARSCCALDPETSSAVRPTRRGAWRVGSERKRPESRAAREAHRRPAERPPRAARSGDTASWSGCRRGPSTRPRGGCRPWRSSECRTCVADRGSAAVVAVPRTAGQQPAETRGRRRTSGGRMRSSDGASPDARVCAKP